MAHSKQCVVCWKEFVIYDSIKRTCSMKCQNVFRNSKVQKRADVTKRRRLEKIGLPKNVRRWVSLSVKEEVYERDWRKCVCCGTSNSLERVPHHVFYWSEANLTSTRNDADQLVTICLDCHHLLHFREWGHLLKLKCKEYLYSLYGPERYGRT